MITIPATEMWVLFVTSFSVDSTLNTGTHNAPLSTGAIVLAATSRISFVIEFNQKYTIMLVEVVT